MAEITLQATRPPHRAPDRPAASAPRARSPASSTASAPTPSRSRSIGASCGRPSSPSRAQRPHRPRGRRRAQPTIVKDMQRHPIAATVLHVDFLRVDRDETVDVDVPVVLEGEAEAVDDENGMVDQLLTSLLIIGQAGRHPQRDHDRHLRAGDRRRHPGRRPRAARRRHHRVDPEEAVVTASHQVAERRGRRRRGRGRRGRGGRRGRRRAAEAAGAGDAGGDADPGRRRGLMFGRRRGRGRAPRHPGRPAGRRPRQPRGRVRRHPPQRGGRRGRAARRAPRRPAAKGKERALADEVAGRRSARRARRSRRPT